MALSNDNIKLDPLYCPENGPYYDSSNVQRVWGELVYRSVEAISASLAGVEDFAEECVYMAAINAKVGTEQSASPSQARDLLDDIEQGVPLDFGDPSTVGLVYLKASSLPGTFDIGVAIVPEQRGNKWGPEAIRLVMGWAFEELCCHRIQARVVESNGQWRDIAMGVFMRLGFNLEGTSRRALFCPTHPMDPYPEGVNGEWRDVTHLAILDVDWVMYSARRQAPSAFMKSKWEELFAREEKERAELLRFEEQEEKRRHAKRKRTVSMEPIGTSFELSCSSPHPIPEYPFNSTAEVLDKGKEVDKSSYNDALSRLFQATLTHSQNPSPAPITNAHDEDWNAQTLHEVGVHRSPHGRASPALSYTSNTSIMTNRYISDAEEGVHSPVLSSASSSSVTYDTDDSDDPFTDAESVPRSTSVVSENSTRGRQDTDEWDFVDNASVGSSASARWSTSDHEL